MSQLDQQLEKMRRAHRATARYLIYLKPANFVKGRTVIATGLTWDEANERRDALNESLGPPTFCGAMYAVELEQSTAMNSNDPPEYTIPADPWAALPALRPGRQFQKDGEVSTAAAIPAARLLPGQAGWCALGFATTINPPATPFASAEEAVAASEAFHIEAGFVAVDPEMIAETFRRLKRIDPDEPLRADHE